jgi:hypothetical protein
MQLFYCQDCQAEYAVIVTPALAAANSAAERL